MKTTFALCTSLLALAHLAACSADAADPGERRLTVSFDARDGSVPATQVVSPGSKVPRPADPVWPKHVFEGWYKEVAGLNPWDFLVDSVVADTTLYARWTDLSPLTFVTNAGTIEITRFAPSHAGGYAMPSSIDGYPVTAIGDAAFADCAGLTALALPAGIVRFGAAAFSNCAALATVTFPPGLTNIGKAAFYGCAALAACSISANLEYIAEYAFADCASLTNVFIPGNILDVGAGAFQGCSALATLVIQNGLYSLGSCSFYHCTSLKTVALPASLRDIRQSAFEFCYLLESVSLSTGLLNIYPRAFIYCEKLAEITIPDTVDRIATSAFEGCWGLREIHLGTGVSTLDMWAFKNCYSISNLYAHGFIAPYVYGLAFEGANKTGVLHVKPGALGYDAAIWTSSFAAAVSNL